MSRAYTTSALDHLLYERRQRLCTTPPKIVATATGRVKADEDRKVLIIEDILSLIDLQIKEIILRDYVDSMLERERFTTLKLFAAHYSRGAGDCLGNKLFLHENL